MSRRYRYLFVLCLAAALLVVGLHHLLWHSKRGLEQSAPAGRLPRIRPDYTGIVIPPNIAPLNFCVEEPGRRFFVRMHSDRGKGIEVFSGTPRIVIPLRAWRRLLEANRGGELCCDVHVKAADGKWTQYKTIRNTISHEKIDPYMVYRRINPMYNIYTKMSIRQCNLENYEDNIVLHNSSFGGCVNCHTFLKNRTDTMVMHFRHARMGRGGGMLLFRNGVVGKVDTRTRFSPGLAGFSSWHPSGRVLAFSINKVRQFFHSARPEVREGIDLKSDLAIYVLDSNAVTSTAAISAPDRLETYPAWSPDGRYLYFCSAPMLWSDPDEVPPERFADVRYDLMRIGYDVGTGTWGQLETVLSAEDTGLSITQARFDPSGRFLVFCMSQYSTFPTFQPDSDLYLMDLGTGRYERMACNSQWAESWHCWSSNGRWIVFSSKREDGQFLKAYFSYVDQSGTAHKAFVLPQKDPTYYDWFFKLYQLPELVREPIRVTAKEIARVIRSPDWVRGGLPVTAATPRAASPPDRGQAGSPAIPDRRAR